jgi:3-isopropylmalate dehydrogenase
MKSAVMPGDGIGPEVVGQAIKVLDRVGEKCGFKLQYRYADIGGIAIDKTGVPCPTKRFRFARLPNAVLLGAVGGYQWDDLPGDKRPEAGLWESVPALAFLPITARRSSMPR